MYSKCTGGKNTGIWDRFRKKKEEKVEATSGQWVLKKKNAKGSYEKVLDLIEFKDAEALTPILEAGVYIEHLYEKGKMGFTKSYGPFEVFGEVPEGGEAKEVAPQQKKRPFEELKEYAEDIKATQEDLKAVFVALGPMLGLVQQGQVVQQKTLVEQIKEARALKDDLEVIFPTASTNSQEIPIDGKIPAWMAFAPTVVEKMLDGVDQRLNKWGIIGGNDGTAVPAEIVRLPDRPKASSSMIDLPKRKKKEEEDTDGHEPEKQGD